MPKNVLFVCIENARRSQMAEAIFNQLAKEMKLEARATSAGTMPSDKIDPNIARVLEEIGVRVEDRRPRSLNNNMIAEADAIVTMGCLSKEVCPSVFIDKTIDWNIEDPKGKPIEKVREIRDEVRAKVEELIRQLSENC